MSSVCQAMVLYYKNGEKQPFERCHVDLMIKEEECEKIHLFKKRLIEKECLAERCTQHQINKFNVKVGYCEKVQARGQPTTGLGVFVESLNNEQFGICCSLVRENKSIQLTLKVNEEIDTQFFGSTKTKKLPSMINGREKETCERNDVEVTAVVSSSTSPTICGKIDDKSNSVNMKRGVKRSNVESGEDDELWKNLKDRMCVVRNKRQQLRLDKWTQDVKEKSMNKFTAKNERYVICNKCETEFTVNKINAINDLGKKHKSCVVSAGKYRQKKLSF